MAETRKIAAILVADIVGYSRLAGADEDRTLARLRALRSDLFDPTIAVHHGRIVKRTGDGSLIEFRSVVDAVRCAIEVQNGLSSSPEVIRLVVMMYVRYPLSLRNVEDLLAERGIDISHETVRFWWNRFGPMFAAEIRKRRVAHLRGCPQWRWHLDEVFVRVNGKLCYLWRAVDHEGEILEAVVTARRNKAAALKLLKRIMKRYGQPRKIVTDGLCSYSAAMKETGAADRHEVGGRLNNRAENSHQPFRRRERAMQRFRSAKTRRSSARFTPRSTTFSIRSGISFPAKRTSRDALPYWPSGEPLRHKSSLARGHVALRVDEAHLL